MTKIYVRHLKNTCRFHNTTKFFANTSKCFITTGIAIVTLGFGFIQKKGNSVGFFDNPTVGFITNVGLILI